MKKLLLTTLLAGLFLGAINASALIEASLFTTYASKSGDFVDGLKTNTKFTQAELKDIKFTVGASGFMDVMPMLKVGLDATYFNIVEYDDNVKFKEVFQIMPVVAAAKFSILDIAFVEGGVGFAPGFHSIKPYVENTVVADNVDHKGSMVGMIGVLGRFGGPNFGDLKVAGLQFGIDVGAKYYHFLREPSLNVFAVTAGVTVGL